MTWLRSLTCNLTVTCSSISFSLSSRARKEANRLNPLSTPSDFKSAECQSAHFINHHYLCPLAMFFPVLSFQLCNVVSRNKRSMVVYTVCWRYLRVPLTFQPKSASLLPTDSRIYSPQIVFMNLRVWVKVSYRNGGASQSWINLDFRFVLPTFPGAEEAVHLHAWTGVGHTEHGAGD